MTPAVMEAEAALAQWVLEHKVTWEIGPLQELVDHHAATVGFELRLFGRHRPDARANPGCHECLALHQRLRAIAAAAFPRDDRPSRYEIEPFDGAFHLRPEADWTNEVQLTVRIVHGNGYLRPLDECEKRCADEIQAALRRMGVQPRTWSEAHTAAGRASRAKE